MDSLVGRKEEQSILKKANSTKNLLRLQKLMPDN